MEENTVKKIKLFIVLVVLVIVLIAGYKIYDDMKYVDFNVKVVDGLEVSLDGINFKDEITREDVLNLGDSYSKAISQVPSKLGSISSALDVTSGYMDMFHVNYTDNGTELTALKESEINCAFNKECKDKNFIAFDIFLLAKEPTTLLLTKNSKVFSQFGKGNNNYYNAARVAFVVEGTVTEENKEVAQSLSGGSKAVLWEPNYDVNKEKEEKLLSYKAVDAEIKSKLSVSQIKGNFNFSKVEADVYTKANNEEDTILLDVQAGITKIRVYLWMESQDVDMKPNAKTNKLNYTIELGAYKKSE